MRPHPRAILRVLLFVPAFSQGPAIARGDGYTPFEGEKSSWHGFDRYDYLMDDETLDITPFKRPDGEGAAVRAPDKGKRRCVVVVPKEPAAGNPWSWQGQYWDHEPQTEVDLLRR